MEIFSDDLLEVSCIHCGGKPETRDHVSSKIILYKPFPENLPVAPACDKCNQDFSKDEEYFARLIECILRCTTEPDKLEREKVKDILNKNPKLSLRLDF